MKKKKKKKKRKDKNCRPGNLSKSTHNESHCFVTACNVCTGIIQKNAKSLEVTFVHCKISMPAIGQNRSRNFGLSVNNRQDRAAKNHNLSPSLQKIQTTAYINQNDFY